LIEENKALAEKLEEKTLDHDSASFACRTAQRELQKLQEKEGRMVCAATYPTDRNYLWDLLG
jgi:hypothetical protein